MTKVTSWNGNPILKWLLAIHGLIIWTPNQKKIFGPPRATPKKYLPYLRGCLWMSDWIVFYFMKLLGPEDLGNLQQTRYAKRQKRLFILWEQPMVLFFGGWILMDFVYSNSKRYFIRPHRPQPVNHAIKMLMEAAPIHHDFLQPSINWSIKQPLIAFGLVRFYPIPCKELQGDNNHPNTNHRWATNKKPGLTFHWILVVQYGSL